MGHVNAGARRRIIVMFHVKHWFSRRKTKNDCGACANPRCVRAPSGFLIGAVEGQ
jgi:hypothetical protein